MSSVVYSAAKAILPFPGKTKEEVWKELTEMFDPNVNNPKSYIVNNYRLECDIRLKPNEITSGDLFKYQGYSGSWRYIPIVECTPYESFAYEERSSPYNVEEINGKARMDFFLRSDSEGTVVEIIRRHKGNPPTFREWLFTKLGVSDDSGDNAVYLLRSITNSPPGANGNIPWIKGTTVRRDDSHRSSF